MTPICSICGIFQNEGWELENTFSNQYADLFPENYHMLDLYFDLENSRNERILQCPLCESFFSYQCTVPGGSYDAQQTYIIQRLIPISKQEADNLIATKQNQSAEPTTSEFKCSKCHSSNIVKTNSGTIGCEAFVFYECQDCGTTITIDGYS